MKDLFDYRPASGKLYWKSGNRKGQRAGTFNRKGYRQVGVNGKIYLEHRLIWFLVTGSWPTQYIDHANKSKADNRWSNLREASPSESVCNRNTQVNNKAGRRGVYPSSVKGKWSARITCNSVRIFLGNFSTEDEAASAYAEASKQFHGRFSST